MNNSRTLICLCICLIGGTTYADTAERKKGHQAGEEFRYVVRSSGSGVPSNEIDFNGDMQGGLSSFMQGKGTFGKSSSNTAIDTFFVGDPCDTAEGPGAGLTLEYAGYASVLRVANGDLLYRQLATSPPSTLCFDPVNSKVSSEIYLDIKGGTGRFKNAEGSSVIRTSVDVMPGPNGVTGVERGRIRLN